MNDEVLNVKDLSIEYITEESLFKSARIFARAIVRLAGKKVEE